MFDWIISCSVIIIIFVFLRFIFKNKVSAKFQYTLWLIVLIRLLVPFNLFSSSFSLQNLLDSGTQYSYYFVNDLPLYILPDTFEQTAPDFANNILKKTSGDYSTFAVVWGIGMLVLAFCLLISNLHFYMRVRRSRARVSVENYPLSVFVCGVTSNPCLYGVVNPKVYMTRCDFEDEKKRAHILAHEYTHYKHRDNLWSFLRCICLVLHWYNPLVWLAVILSKADAEFACDENTVNSFDEENKSEYGRTIIALSSKERYKGLLFAPAAALYGKAMLKQRIKRLVNHKKTVIGVVAFVVIMCIWAVGFTFSDSNNKAVAIPITIAENVQSQRSEAVFEYAADCVTKRIEELALSGVTVYEATITEIEQIATGLVALIHTIDTYRLSYELSVYGEIPPGVDVTVNEAGFITEQTSNGDTYFILIDVAALVGVGEIEYAYYRAGEFTTADMQKILTQNNQNLQGANAVSYVTSQICIQTGYESMIGDAYDIYYALHLDC